MAEAPAQIEVELVPTGQGLGARVHGVDLAKAPCPEHVETLTGALARHGVLIFSGVTLTHDEQVRFTSAFGSTMGQPLGDEIAGANPGGNQDCVYLVNEPGQA